MKRIKPTSVPTPVIRCNHCGKNLYQTGIREVIEQATAYMDITFDGSSIMIGRADITEANDIYCQCMYCGKVLFGGRVQATDIIDFCKGKTEYIRTYVAWSGGSPNPAALEKERNTLSQIMKRCWN